MAQVVGVRFERAGKIYYFGVGEFSLSLGDNVIVESSRGLDFGTVATSVQEVADKDVPQPLKPVLRLATVADEKRFDEFKAKEPDAFEFCRQQILAAGLPMKLIRAAYSFDGSKIVFYFTSENRVDFRDLVKVLAAHFHARIELRQVGVRDEARLVGGYSSCGRELCCAAFLNGFHPVSIKMAKKQNLALNPAKISGVCGRLMCCLYYEYDENAPDEPEMDEQMIACDNNCAACGDKPCARLADEPDLEESVAVADSAELVEKPEKARREPKNRNHNEKTERSGKGDRREKNGEKNYFKQKSNKNNDEKNSENVLNGNAEKSNDKNNERRQNLADDGAEQGERRPGANRRRNRGRRGGRPKAEQSSRQGQAEKPARTEGE